MGLFELIMILPDISPGEAAQQEADDVYRGPGQCGEHIRGYIRDISQVSTSVNRNDPTFKNKTLVQEWVC